MAAQTVGIQRRNIIAHAVAFILGFAVVFIVAGMTASAAGQLFDRYRSLITELFGIIVIAFGLNMLGVYHLPFLAMDKRVQVRTSRISYVGSFLVGIGFAAGWSPCIGPILAAVLAMASDTHTVSSGAALLAVYALGLALPFLITAIALQSVLPLLARLKRFLRAIEIFAGLLVTAMGLILVANKWLWFAGYLYAHFPALTNIGVGPSASGGAISFGAAFLAGIVSFISPCVLPLVPVYLSFITGQSLPQLLAAYEA